MIFNLDRGADSMSCIHPKMVPMSITSLMSSTSRFTSKSIKKELMRKLLLEVIAKKKNNEEKKKSYYKYVVNQKVGKARKFS